MSPRPGVVKNGEPWLFHKYLNIFYGLDCETRLSVSNVTLLQLPGVGRALTVNYSQILPYLKLV